MPDDDFPPPPPPPPGGDQPKSRDEDRAEPPTDPVAPPRSPYDFSGSVQPLPAASAPQQPADEPTPPPLTPVQPQQPYPQAGYGHHGQPQGQPHPQASGGGQPPPPMHGGTPYGQSMPYGATGYPGGGPRKPMDGMAIASISCGGAGLLLSSCCGALAIPLIPVPIVAIVLGILSLNKIKKNPDMLQGKGLAIGGIVCGGLAILFSLAYGLFVLFAATADPTFMEEMLESLESY